MKCSAGQAGFKKGRISICWHKIEYLRFWGSVEYEERRVGLIEATRVLRMVSEWYGSPATVRQVRGSGTQHAVRHESLHHSLRGLCAGPKKYLPTHFKAGAQPKKYLPTCFGKKQHVRFTKQHIQFGNFKKFLPQHVHYLVIFLQTFDFGKSYQKCFKI